MQRIARPFSIYSLLTEKERAFYSYMGKQRDGRLHEKHIMVIAIMVRSYLIFTRPDILFVCFSEQANRYNTPPSIILRHL